MLALIVGCSGEPAGVELAGRPNVLLVTVDTLRRDAVGWIGGVEHTPTMDRLAEEGFRFARAVAPVPLTLPTHTTMMTGLVPRRHGVRDNGQVLGETVPTLGERLIERGYRTAAFVGGFPLRSHFGLDRGFEHYDDDLPGGEEGWLERPATETTARAVEWINAAEGPWFVWVHYYDPHAPYEPPRNFWQPGARGSYDGEVAFVDHAIEQLLAGIPGDARTNLLTVFTADHGESFGEHDERDHGLFIYDTTVLVPLVFHYPAELTPGESELVPRLVDLMPTLSSMLGLAWPEEVDGRDISPLLAGRTLEPAPAFVETRYPWITYGWAPLRAWRTDAYKLIDAPRPELYDLIADPNEETNLFDERPEIVEELMTVLQDEASLPAAEAVALVDPETLASLEALGYVGGTSSGDEPPEGLPDPKDRINERNILLAAESLMRAGKLGRALAAFDDVLSRDPDNRYAVLRSGITLLKAGRLQEAIPRLEQATELDPSQPEARYALADALTRTGQYDRAIPEWMETARLQPRRVAAWSNLASTLGWTGRLDEAIEAFNHAAQLEPDNPRLWINLATAESAAGKTDDAIEHLERAAALDDQSFDQRGTLGLLLTKQGRVEEAIDWLSTTSPTESTYATAQFQLAIVELGRGDRQKAKKALDRALAADPRLESQLVNTPELAKLR